MNIQDFTRSVVAAEIEKEASLGSALKGAGSNLKTILSGIKNSSVKDLPGGFLAALKGKGTNAVGQAEKLLKNPMMSTARKGAIGKGMGARKARQSLARLKSGLARGAVGAGAAGVGLGTYKAIRG